MSNGARGKPKNEAQLELSLGVVPVPAAGTVAILRLEDWLKLRAAPAPTHAARREATSLKDQRNVAIVSAWLRGGAAVGAYARVQRDAAGQVESCTIPDVIAACDMGPGLCKKGQALMAGRALSILGWRWRYLTAASGQRERRYFPPADWASA